MEVFLKDQSLSRIKTDLLVLPVKEHETRGTDIRLLDRILRGKLSQRIQKSKFAASEGSFLLHGTSGMLGATHLLLVGMGKEGEIGTDAWRKMAARGKREAEVIGAEEFGVYLPPDQQPEAIAGPIVEGALLASYRFDKYRSNSKPSANIRSMSLFRPGLKTTAGVKRSIERATALVPGVFLARDLVNEPPSVSTARYLGEQAKRHCRGAGLSVDVWGVKKIQEMRLAGLLAVNRGSAEEPRFIIIHYKPKGKASKKVALIGKGITFDSGGLSLKQPKSMETMKLDMAGGAAIIGAMSLLPELAPEVEVTGYIPTTDNLPGGSAQKPGDIIRYLNGKTVEVLNTDAEGRLILADGLALAAKTRPDCMINLATLTGACVIALGNEVAGLFSNQQPLADSLIRCGREAGEKLWQLPLVKEYREEIKSSIADIKNIGGSSGGAIMAALILQEFVGDVPWAHLDIAGPAFSEKDGLMCPRGGTGFGVRTLVQFFQTFEEASDHGRNYAGARRKF
ncbi:MAG: leucyl aminopeptidase [Deltaproteobacteria bacterium]|nr:leucyl aminopeptidase [Deltaproteobacteria bacterium]